MVFTGSTQIWVPGPTQIWVGIGAVGAYEFLGYSEDAVGMNFRGSFQNVNADYGGPGVPVDVQYNGEDATISATLIKFDESVLTGIVTRIPNLTPGSPGAQGVGSLMITEGYAYKLLVYSPYNTKSAYSGLTKGYVFGASWLDGDFPIPLGITPKKPRCIFRAIPTWNTTTLASTLYTTTMPSPLPAPD